MWGKRTKFALELKDNQEIMTMAELRRNFELEKIVEYVENGKLEKWLRDRFYYDEADEVANLDINNVKVAHELCTILGVDYEIIPWWRERVERLKQFTRDPEILKQVDNVAFDQDDLEIILSQDKIPAKVYLCDGVYIFPSGILRIKNVTYVGIGKVTVVIDSSKKADFSALKVFFSNIELNRNRNYIKPVAEEKTATSPTPRTEQKISAAEPEQTNSATHAERKSMVKNANGVHARPASIFVQTANKFKSRIQIAAKNKKVDAKSLLMLMSIGLDNRNEFTIMADGEDAQEAVDALVNLVETRLNDE